MKLRKEVLNRLLLAKSILSPAVNGLPGQTNAHVIARQVLNAHDAADLVFAAIADQQSKLSAKGRAPAMIECLDLIGTKGRKHAAYFKQLNDARNSLKHVGNLPSTQQWSRVTEDVSERLSSVCLSTLRVRLEDVDELEFLQSDDVKVHLRAARQYARSRDFRAALEETARALSVAFWEHPDHWTIRVGRADAGDALKLAAYGVPANDFLRLQEFLPMASRTGSEPLEVLWKQSQFGHPGNWREDVARFCINAALGVALGIQDASRAPSAIELRGLYEYKVTAIEDQVEIWEDLIRDHLQETHGIARPFRIHKSFLAKGESITVSGYAEPLVSDDVSSTGESIKRVRVSPSNFDSIFPRARAGYVNLSQVRVTCVPHEYLKHKDTFGDRFQHLSEIPWEEDPLAFSI